jgi:hypothetical protein
MRGELVHKTWPAHPELNAPIRFRNGCDYAAFIPFPLETIELQLPASLARTISDAEKAISELNRDSGTELLPLARLLLRTESIASSKVEGMQVDARALLRAEAKQETGLGIGTNAAEILGNIDAMQLAIERASSLEGIRVKDILDIHRALLERAPNPRIAGQLRTSQNWIGGNDYNPCGADFVPPPLRKCHVCSKISAASVTRTHSLCSSKQPLPTRNSRRSIPSMTATAELDAL